MARRHKTSPDDFKTLNDKIEQRVKRFWLFFLIGLIIDSLHIEISKINIMGAEASFKYTSALPGIFYLMSVIYFLYSFMSLSIAGSQHVSDRRIIFRNMIYQAMGKSKTFKRKSRADIIRIKRTAVASSVVINIFYLSILLIPALVIIIFKHSQLSQALKIVVSGA